MRAVKTPTRRQLAHAVDATLIPALNTTSQNLDYLKREIEGTRTLLASFMGMSRWQRLKWLLRGHL